jgi:hypothetical protein
LRLFAGGEFREAATESCRCGDKGEVEMSDEQVRSSIVQSMAEAEFPPAVIYAFHKTGIYICDENEARLSDEQKTAWNAAINEYRRSEH